MNREVTEVASWRIVSELFRRYPGKFQLIETHPGGGMYDCLSLLLDGGHLADLNRAGTLHVKEKPPLDIWRLMTEKSVRDVLDLICHHLQLLPVPGKLPPSTPEVITYRFIASFLSHSIFGRDRWDCRNGHIDTSGMESPGTSAFFKHFPGAKERLRESTPADPLNIPAHRFWFIIKDGRPFLCMEITGRAWNARGYSFDVAGLYRKEKRIWPVVWQVAGDLLP